MSMLVVHSNTSSLMLYLRVSIAWICGEYKSTPKHLSWRLVKGGAPAAVTGMQRAMSQLIVIGIVAPFGDAALAASP